MGNLTDTSQSLCEHGVVKPLKWVRAHAQFTNFACAHIGRIHSYDVGSRFCGKPTGV